MLRGKKGKRDEKEMEVGRKREIKEAKTDVRKIRSEKGKEK